MREVGDQTREPGTEGGGQGASPLSAAGQGCRALHAF